MTVEDLKNALPAYAKDLKPNLSSLLQEASLTEQQRAGTFVASAMAAGHALTIGAIAETFRPKMSAEAFDAARAAAAIMAMNNVYYRFTHLVSATEYRNLPARLRMNVIGNPGVDKVDFELWALAVSAINGCGACVDSASGNCASTGSASRPFRRPCGLPPSSRPSPPPWRAKTRSTKPRRSPLEQDCLAGDAGLGGVVEGSRV